MTFQLTVLAEVWTEEQAMNDEPLRLVALLNRIASYEDVVREANRLPYDLAANAYTASATTISALSRDILASMPSIDHHSLALAELLFGSLKGSGYGSDDGSEAIENYLKPGSSRSPDDPTPPEHRTPDNIRDELDHV